MFKSKLRYQYNICNKNFKGLLCRDLSGLHQNNVVYTYYMNKTLFYSMN